SIESRHGSSMDVTLSWFLCLCLERKLLEPKTLGDLRAAVPPEADAVAYGEMMLDLGITEDTALLQDLLDEACDREDAEGGPPCDPFSLLPKKSISLRGATIPLKRVKPSP